MLRIIVEGDAGAGKSAIGTLIEDMLVDHGFMVMANIDAPRSKEQASKVARSVSEHDRRVILIEHHQTTREDPQEPVQQPV